MPAQCRDIAVEAGSYDPIYWMITDPATGSPLDLTQPGYLVHGVVADHADGTGRKLLDLVEGAVWSRTADGRVYFQPSSTTSSGWAGLRGFYMAELDHPSGQTVRFAEGRFVCDYDFARSA